MDDYSRAAWTVSNLSRRRPMPLVSIPRMIHILEAFKLHLDSAFPRDSAFAVARELGEDPRVVLAMAMRIIHRAENTRMRNRPTIEIGAPDDRESEESMSTSFEPFDQAALPEWSALNDARDHLIDSLNAAAAALAHKPVIRDRMIDLRNRYCVERSEVQEAPAAEVRLWSRRDFNAFLREQPDRDITEAALHKQVERLWDEVLASPTLIAGFENYFETLAALQRALQGEEGDGNDRPTT